MNQIIEMQCKDTDLVSVWLCYHDYVFNYGLLSLCQILYH